MARNLMDRFIDSIEWIAAFFVGVVALAQLRKGRKIEQFAIDGPMTGSRKRAAKKRGRRRMVRAKTVQAQTAANSPRSD